MVPVGVEAVGVVCVTVLAIALCAFWRRRNYNDERHRLAVIHKSPSVNAFDGMVVIGNSPERRPVLGVEQEISRDSICFLKTLGEGDFVKLMKGEASGLVQPDAVTTVLIKTLASTCSKAARRKFLKEISVLSRLENANILPMLAVCSEADPLCMVFEYSELEDLKSYLQAASQVCDSGGNSSMFSMLKTPDLSGMLLDIAMAVEYLQVRQICHTDISTRHCQVVPGGSVKLAPFHFIVPAKHVDDYFVVGDYEQEDGFRGARTLPVRWMAPESLSDGHFDLRSDIWSVGVTAWEIFSYATTPYRGFSCDEIVDQVPSGQLSLATPPQCPHQLWKVVRGCLVRDPSRRVSAMNLVHQVEQLHTKIAQNNSIIDLGVVDDGDIGGDGDAGGDGLLIEPDS